MTADGPGTSAVPHGAGNRRIDRVLAEDYLDGLKQASLQDVRELRGEAEQEEVDLSYIRRMIQGRIDILRAELERRGGGFRLSPTSESVEEAASWLERLEAAGLDGVVALAYVRREVPAEAELEVGHATASQLDWPGSERP